MDHVVRINEGNDTKTPIVLHLLPGEETLFNLVIINDGEPSDISLLASDPVFKAVRFRRSDDHVDGKQIIPIFARMPADTDRLDGEIILKSSNGESRVPITILRDSEGPRADRHSATEPERPGRSGRSVPSSRVGRVSSRARIRDIALAEGVQKEDYQDERSNPDPEAIEEYGIDPYGIHRDMIDPDGMDDGGEDEDHDPNDPYEDPDTEFIPAKDGGSEEDEKDSGHLSFSKDQDLEKYRSGRRFRQVEDLSETDGNNHSHEGIGPVRESGYSTGNDGYFGADDSDHDQFDRPTDQFDPFDPSRSDRGLMREEADQDPESLFGRKAGRRASLGLSEGEEEPTDQFDSDQIRSGMETGEDLEEDDDLRAIGATHIIPAVIFLGLVGALVLTFITESVPEFPGALVSSILIVTLIIYGAATLLKA